MQLEQLRRFEQIDHLIRIKGTGSPDELAARLGISRRSLYDYINYMKEMGAPIKYCMFRGTYYYTETGSFKAKFTFFTEAPEDGNNQITIASSILIISQMLLTI